MRRTQVTAVYTCAVCRKPTSRLLGFAAVVNLAGEDVRASRHTAVMGYCAAHRDQIPNRFTDEVATKGEVLWVCDEPFDLRPSQVEGWYIDVDRIFATTVDNTGATRGAAMIEVNTPEQLPRVCPHCDGELAWDVGPHVAEAAERRNAFAWECVDCRSAGILQLT
ncbi:hypothetical protein [Nocardia cyriacigeorgica]|uniref:hypothetical protein n=1 Tax=Nocardia cyriacigeorgica TaxID=135487 RepID=UPI002458DC7D|nr:hypothetical protein [Nocardia cyriacigeorgica]